MDLLGFCKLTICGTLSLYNKLVTFWLAIFPQGFLFSSKLIFRWLYSYPELPALVFGKGRDALATYLMPFPWTCSASANYQYAVHYHCSTSWQLVPALLPQGFIFSSKLFNRRLYSYPELPALVFGKGRDALATYLMPINGLARHPQITNLRYVIIVQQVGNLFLLYLRRVLSFLRSLSSAGAYEYLCLLGWRVGIDYVFIMLFHPQVFLFRHYKNDEEKNRTRRCFGATVWRTKWGV